MIVIFMFIVFWDQFKNRFLLCDKPCTSRLSPLALRSRKAQNERDSTLVPTIKYY